MENDLSTAVRKILEQLFYDILAESPNRRHATQGAWTNIPTALREQQGVEALYMELQFPFTHCQYTLCDEVRWLDQFNRFFPTTNPTAPRQNFKKAKYLEKYINLLGNLTPQNQNRMRGALKLKFDSLAWVPHAGSDHMWETKKTHEGRWQHLPLNEERQGPHIAINPNVRQRHLWPPALRPAPAIEQLREEEEEESSDEEL
ncbi:hypothetical protein SCLCIDRAFT_134317 [Scleroderma citrinum Foug A]|uniref:Uncharacterized protein n=1 Tax=Scleroderma citrinum Foug A TaxID=1036808 RepID=A0A0C3D4H5_9AGAM|nr:hypothetical protein SCLCIDRAFT_134317 [Scleroderma citrinum Foug A]